MTKFLFLRSETITRLLILNFVFVIFGFYKLFFYIFIVSSLIFFLFRKRRRKVNDILSPDQSLILSPISGQLIDIEYASTHMTLIFKIGIFQGFGIYMPIDGEIIDHREKVESHGNILKPYLSEVLFQDKALNKFKITTNCIHPLLKPNLLVGSGDRARIGGTLGYFPFGGKVSLEIPKNCDVIIGKNDRLLSSQTAVAKIKER